MTAVVAIVAAVVAATMMADGQETGIAIVSEMIGGRDQEIGVEGQSDLEWVTVCHLRLHDLMITHLQEEAMAHHPVPMGREDMGHLLLNEAYRHHHHLQAMIMGHLQAMTERGISHLIMIRGIACLMIHGMAHLLMIRGIALPLTIQETMIQEIHLQGGEDIALHDMVHHLVMGLLPEGVMTRDTMDLLGMTHAMDHHGMVAHMAAPMEMPTLEKATLRGSHHRPHPAVATVTTAGKVMMVRVAMIEMGRVVTIERAGMMMERVAMVTVMALTELLGLVQHLLPSMVLTVMLDHHCGMLDHHHVMLDHHHGMLDPLHAGLPLIEGFVITM